MNLFEAVKQNVTTRQAAERYGIRIRRNGMAVCPFHNDKNPSMKLDRRFHCFGCQADGDAVDFVSRLFGLPSKEAAMKIADDFGISYDSRQKPSIRPKIREPTPEQKYQQEENHCYKVLSDYFHLLRKWEKQYAPQRTDEVWHPLFVEALRILSPLSAGRKKPIKCRMKPIRQTACDNVCSEVLPTRWTFYPLTEAATVDFCLSWYTLKMQRFTFWKMKPHPERSLI